MKKLGLITILLTTLIFTSVLAQSKLSNHIIGEWKAVKVYDIGAVIPDGSKKQIEAFQTKFINSKFQFNTDHTFSLNTPFTEMIVKNAKWKILSDNYEVIIYDATDKDKRGGNVMGITVLIKDGKTIFMIEETFLAFEMEKTKSNE